MEPFAGEDMNRRGFLGLLLGGVAVLAAMKMPGAEAANRFVTRHIFRNPDGTTVEIVSRLTLAC